MSKYIYTLKCGGKKIYFTEHDIYFTKLMFILKNINLELKSALRTKYIFYRFLLYRLYSLCKNWSQVFSLHPCDWEFMFLSCWCCLRTESSFWKAEDLASQIGCYWHDGPKLDWWVALATATLQHPHQPHKKSDGLSEGRLTWLPSIYSVYTSPFQSGPIKMYQRPKSMKLSSRQNLTCKYSLDKIHEIRAKSLL